MDKITLKEAKKLFQKHHPAEADVLVGNNNYEYRIYADCVWHGFKSALKITGKLKE